MKFEAKITIVLDLGDGRSPIPCNGLQEAEFLKDVWLGSQGNFEALARLRARYPTMPKNA
jgi:hypothetical protein